MVLDFSASAATSTDRRQCGVDHRKAPGSRRREESRWLIVASVKMSREATDGKERKRVGMRARGVVGLAAMRVAPACGIRGGREGGKHSGRSIRRQHTIARLAQGRILGTKSEKKENAGLRYETPRASPEAWLHRDRSGQTSPSMASTSLRGVMCVLTRWPLPLPRFIGHERCNDLPPLLLFLLPPFTRCFFLHRGTWELNERCFVPCRSHALPRTSTVGEHRIGLGYEAPKEIYLITLIVFKHLRQLACSIQVDGHADTLLTATTLH